MLLLLLLFSIWGYKVWTSLVEVGGKAWLIKVKINSIGLHQVVGGSTDFAGCGVNW